MMGSLGDNFWRTYSHVYALMENISFVKDQYARHMNALKGLRVILDAGCGVGSLTVKLTDEPDRTLLGIDENLAMLSVAERRLLKANGSHRVAITQGDVGALPCATGTVDGYVSNNVLHCVKNEQSVLEEMSRVVESGGRACIASARPCMDVEVLLKAMEAELGKLRDARAIECFEKFATVNRSLQRELRNLHEPDEFAEQLEHTGCWKVLEATATYLDQNFFVVATRV